MDRRRFVTLAGTSAAASLLPRIALAAPPPPKARNIVLAHGLFADGSCWSKVIARLEAKGLHATAVQNPLTTLDDAVAATQRVLALQDGATVLVGHSFAGMIVTEAGVDPKVTSLVYVAARAPDAGEDFSALAGRFPKPPASAGVVFTDEWGQLGEEAFLHDFANGVPEKEARVLFAVQEPFKKTLVTERTTHAAWHSKPKLLRRFQAGPRDRSRSRAVPGETDGRHDDRGRRGPPVADLAPRRDRQAHPASGRADLREDPLV